MIRTGAYLGSAEPTGNGAAAPTFDKETGQLMIHDLRNNLIWPPRDQGLAPTCTAFAAIACVELIQANSPNVPHFSAGFMYYHMYERIKADSNAPSGAVKFGFTRFKDAVEVLRKTGYVEAATWPELATEAPPNPFCPSPTPFGNVSFRAFPIKGTRPKDLASEVYRQLKGKKPVGAALPEYRRPGGSQVTNWTPAFEHGIVAMPRPGDILDIVGGHAICIVGFTGADGSPPECVNDGYFLFRYSGGENFAGAPTTGYPQGYGLLPAKLLDKCCWELMFMSKDPPKAESEP